MHADAVPRKLLCRSDGSSDGATILPTTILREPIAKHLSSLVSSVRFPFADSSHTRTPRTSGTPLNPRVRVRRAEGFFHYPAYLSNARISRSDISDDRHCSMRGWFLSVFFFCSPSDPFRSDTDRRVSPLDAHPCGCVSTLSSPLVHA